MSFNASLWGRGVLLTGLTPASTLSGYVALVSLDNVPTESIDAGANSALNGGGDLRFSTDINGTNQLPLEVVSFVVDATPSNRSCQLWIRFPTYSSAAREVYMFYKKAGETQPPVTDTFGRNAVWVDYDYSNHMDDTGLLNSSNGTSGTYQLGTPTQEAAQIGDGRDFTSEGVDTGESLASALSEFSISAWCRWDGGTTGAEGSVADTWTGTAGWLLRYEPASGGSFEFFTRVGSQNRGGSFTSTSISDGQFHHVAATLQGGNLRVYLDGVASGTLISSGTPNANTVDTYVGRSTTNNAGNDFWIGILDEVRIGNTGLTADRITSEYNNQSDPATFWTTGTPFTPGGGPSFQPAWAINANKLINMVQ